MKILHVAESSRGGCGTYLNEVVPPQIAEFGSNNVLVIAPDRHLLQLQDIAQSAIHPFRRPGRALGLAFLAMQLASSVRRFRPDIIHAHSTFAGALARSLSMILPGMPPILYCAHGWVFDTARTPRIRRWMESIERFLARRCIAIVCISEAEKAAGEAAGIPAQKLVVVPNGVRATLRSETIAEWIDPRLKVLFVGRLDRQKGVDILIEAVRPLTDHVSVRIIGESVLSNAPKPTQSEGVEYLGWRDQEAIGSYMRACDVVVMPSRWEGFGLVAIEAMRFGKPVIASAIGGLLEIIVDRKTGRLIPAEDPLTLRQTLLEHDRASFSDMGEAGRTRFLARYSVERTHAQLKLLYEAIMELPSHRIDLVASVALAVAEPAPPRMAETAQSPPR
jgi:glycosyltransferase involved in cell wall biosynthesis